MQQPRITWKGVGYLAFAVVLSYLGAQVLREASKEMAVTGTGFLVLGGLVSIAAHKIPALPK
jgi:hypothetical protein